MSTRVSCDVCGDELHEVRRGVDALIEVRTRMGSQIGRFDVCSGCWADMARLLT